ncbi:uncharacterized protein PAC_11428 [Phialocephala subalpina]|uniref:C2H2-domain containing protein second zinc finger domain-containing protein n=1 Tax=Phialocephala subalpina TaxID=576137 RepID=A0A1L7X934_9HELO|nr:uncharacterized protein PAC_11428 [Phialocephala subalpina]
MSENANAHYPSFGDPYDYWVDDQSGLLLQDPILTDHSVFENPQLDTGSQFQGSWLLDESQQPFEPKHPNQGFNTWAGPLPGALTSPLGSFNTSDMVPNPESILPAPQSGRNSTLKCPYTDCTVEHDFSSKAALEHNTPNIQSQIFNCKHPRFGDKPGLERHEREVHGSEDYRCPLTSCKRHSRGFNRRYNLLDHMRRCHPRAAIPDTNSQGVADPRSDGAGNDGEEVSEQETAMGTEGMGLKSEKQQPREMLKQKRLQRARLDGDIEALERSLAIMEDS